MGETIEILEPLDLSVAIVQFARSVIEKYDA